MDDGTEGANSFRSGPPLSFSAPPPLVSLSLSLSVSLARAAMAAVSLGERGQVTSEK